jgi:ADP-heptose:LPS heptosyltransferase
MTPCLSALKRWRPEIKITVISEKPAAELLEGHDLIDRLIVVSGGLVNKLDLIRGLRQNHYDVAVNLHGGTTGTFIAALSGARYTLGYRGYRYSRLLKLRAPSPDCVLGKTTIHSVEQQLALLNWAGVAWPQCSNLNLPVSAAARRNVENRLGEMGFSNSQVTQGGYAIISPAASHQSKRWPARMFAEVAQYLGEVLHVSSLVISADGELPIAEEVVKEAGGSARIISGLNLSELAALISGARLFVGNDSGPMHIAAAMRIPTVAVFGSSDPTVWHPWSTAPYRVVLPDARLADSAAAKGPAESAANPTTRNPSGSGDRTSKSAIETIRVETVLQAIREVTQESLQPSEPVHQSRPYAARPRILDYQPVKQVKSGEKQAGNE